MPTNLCDGCHGGCCRHYILVVTAFDIIRIADALGLREVDICSFIPIKEQDHSQGVILKENSKQFPFSLLTLKKIDSEVIKGSTRCLFLVEGRRKQPLNGHETNDHPGQNYFGKCGIYPLRPLMCQTYPYAMANDNDMSLISRSISEERILKNGYELCPSTMNWPWGEQNSFSDVDRISSQLAREQFELNTYKRFVKVWNNSVNLHSQNEFFKFMRIEWSNLIKRGACENFNANNVGILTGSDAIRQNNKVLSRLDQAIKKKKLNQ